MRGGAAAQVVSTDFITDTRSSIVDAKAGIQLNPTFVKVPGLLVVCMSPSTACFLLQLRVFALLGAAHQLVRQRVGVSRLLPNVPQIKP
jgi:hypothetical protein